MLRWVANAAAVSGTSSSVVTICVGAQERIGAAVRETRVTRKRAT